MLLEIKCQENIYTINGNLDKSNLDDFNSHFEHILKASGKVVINIENLVRVDESGMKALVKLHNNALAMGKDLSIIG